MAQLKEVKDALKSLTADSVAGDESGFGLLATAALGVAGLIGGLFVHPHHTGFVQPPNPNMPLSYSAQIGI